MKNRKKDAKLTLEEIEQGWGSLRFYRRTTPLRDVATGRL